MFQNIITLCSIAAGQKTLEDYFQKGAFLGPKKPPPQDTPNFTGFHLKQMNKFLKS